MVSTACLARRRVITRKSGKTSQALLRADKPSLIKRITNIYNAVDTLNATVDMVPALGSADKGKITEYKDVRAYILFRKPSAIRLIGLYPVVRTKAFDMVSNGADFRLYLPSKNRFIQGRDEVEKPSENKIENLRPQHFLEALLVRPVEERERPLLVNLTDEDDASYVLGLTVNAANGDLLLRRQVWFDRLTLQISRQLIFDAAGDILTDARYSRWETFDRVLFPKQIEINRPKDEYGVVINVVKMDINKPLGDDKFVLDQPEGSELKIAGETSASTPAAPPPSKAPARKGTTKK